MLLIECCQPLCLKDCSFTLSIIAACELRVLHERCDGTYETVK